MPVLIRAVKASGGSPAPALPTWIEYIDIIPEGSTDTITVPYDNTKVLLNALMYIASFPYTRGYTQSLLFGHRRLNNPESDKWYKFAGLLNYQGSDSSTSYGSVNVDEELGTITFNARGDNYLFRSDTTYRVLLIYQDETQA